MKGILAVTFLIGAALAGSCNHDESTNSLGPNKCTYYSWQKNEPSSECGGNRSCSSYGWC